MQTPLIPSSTNALLHNAPAARQGADAPPTTQFNQVLSRQIKDRPNDAENKQPVQGKDNAATSKPASSTDKSVAKSSSDKKKTTEATDDADEKTESLPATPADLMALVAQVAQFGQANAKTTHSETPSSEHADDVSGVGDTAKKSAKQLDTVDSFKRLDTALVAENNGKNDGVTDQNAKQNPLLSVPTQETLPELSAAGKKQEILSELSASANASEILPNLGSTHHIPLDVMQSAGAGQPTEKLSPHVGTPAWDQALGQKIVWMVGGAQQSASLTLNPPDLGPLQVVLNVSNEQASATFISAQPEVRQAIEAALPKLREMMGEAGIQLGQTNINAGSGSQQNSSGEQNRPSPSSFAHGVATADAPAGTASPVGSMTRQGLVNTFA